jgi:diaminopimelate decarboxylase
MKIYVSGLYSGGNPQPGVGIVRSLRQGFPNAILVGVEYSNRVSGIHWQDLDDLWIQRPWDELDLESYGENVKALLEGGAYWISGSDLEAMWLADLFPEGHRNLLAPPAAGLKRIAKPAVEAHEGLPVAIPTYISTDVSDWDLHAFCRKHNWRVWLKGPYYDAARTPSWDVFEAARNALTKVWSTQKLFLQAHVGGYEESVMLSAYKGELLGAVSMRKRDITPEGKTWAGDVCAVPSDFLDPLRGIVRKLNWTGGGELEMVRDPKNKLWLLEWNPRFPAWVHGATIAGTNLPARLVQEASGVLARPERAESEEFTRVVLEVPVRADYPLPPLPEPFAGAIGHSMKHPSGLPSLAEQLHKRDQAMVGLEEAEDNRGEPVKVPDSFLEDLSSVDFEQVRTPEFLFLETTAEALFSQASERAHRISTNETQVVNAYSIKTNPDPRLIKLARKHGFLAEGISLAEIQAALAVGFRTDECILNGPGKWWPENMLPDGPLHAVFCDSIADLERTVEAMAAGDLASNHVGVRIRTPNVTSRFGIPLDSPKTFRKLIDGVKRLPEASKFGIHFHMASANIGVAQWWHLFESILKWCRSIEKLSGRTIEILDIGGGWFPDDWHDGEEGDFARAVETIRALLPNVQQIVSEPGKAMAQPSMALAMRVLEIQEHEDDYVEAVVDGSIAELPMYFFYPHRMLRQCASTGEWQPLRRGKTHLMGRLCMEHDVVAANVELPEGTKAGDLIVFCDAGGYDRSMSYVFGRG